MCKKALGLLVLLFSGVWAQAQQSQPGYAVLTPEPGSARSVVSAGGPPEPAPLGGGAAMPANPAMPGGYPSGPGYMPGSAPPGMSYPSAFAGMGMGGPPPGYGGPMGPMGAGPGMGAPTGGYPGLDSSMIVGATSTFGAERVWFSVDYMMAWLQKPRIAGPLISEGSASDIHPGALGQPGTVVAFGDANYKFGTYHGFNFSLGANLTDNWSIEADSFLLPSQHTVWTVASDASGNPLIARPVINVQAGAGVPGSFLTSLPGTTAGSTTVGAHSELWGLDLATRYRFELTPYLSGDFLLGYRRMELLENLTVSDVIVPIMPSFTFQGHTVTPAPGASIQDYDRFATNNTFNGVDLGGRLRWQSGFDWFATSLYFKEALGATTETVNISGATSLVSGGGVVTSPGGILALPSNGGNFTRTVFGSVTEGGVSFIITPWKYTRFEVGYSAMYWNSVVRPGNQINYNVSYTQVPTSQNYAGTASGNAPTFRFQSQGLTVQTLNFGLSFYY